MPSALKLALSLCLLVTGLFITTPVLAQTAGESCTYNHTVSGTNYACPGEYIQGSGGDGSEEITCQPKERPIQVQNCTQTCIYQEKRDDGKTYSCTGTLQSDDPTGSGDNTQCKFDASGFVKPICQEVIVNPAGVGGTGGATCDPTKEICDATAETFKAAEFAGFSLSNLLGNGVACELGPIALRGSCTFPKEGKTKVSAYNPSGGALGAASQGLAMVMTTQPASGVQYMADSFREGFGIRPETAYAQVTGTGSLVIQPIQRFWQMTRNLAYLLYIFIFIYIGFAIMFRQKMGQAAVTAQTALPGIIISLILVTFSYFIAGLLIDFAFWGSQFIGVLIYTQLANTDPAEASRRVQNLLGSNNIITLTWSILVNGDTFNATREQVSNTITGVTGQVLPRVGLGIAGILAGCFNPIVGTVTALSGGSLAIPACVIGAVTGGTAGLLGPEVISIVAYLVFLVGLLQAMFRLLFQLIGSYVGIVVATILGPLTLMSSAIPGRGKATETWIRGILANALVFPAIFAAFLVAAALLNIGEPWNLAGSIGTFDQGLPLFGGLQLGFINILLAYGILFMTPTIPAQVKGFMGVKDNNQIQSAVMGGIGAGWGGLMIGRDAIGGGFNRATAALPGLVPATAPGWMQRAAAAAAQRTQRQAAQQRRGP